MSDFKSKLRQIKTYKYDSSEFKDELRTNLMREYRKKNTLTQGTYKKRNFGFKFVLAPVMTALVLIIVMSFNFISTPMTAYAYLAEVDKQHNALKNQGSIIYTTQIINGEEYKIKSNKDSKGNSKIQVWKDDIEISNFLIKDKLLFIKELSDPTALLNDLSDLEYEEPSTLKQQNKLNDLQSILSSIALAELSNPTDEWEKLIKKDGVKIKFLENELVEISYEELVNGKTKNYKLYFRDFQPVSKEIKDLNNNKTTIIKYDKVQVAPNLIEVKDNYEIFTDDTKLNEKVIDFIDEDIALLVNDISSSTEEIQVNLEEREIKEIFG